jgi:hypothetical protein
MTPTGGPGAGGKREEPKREASKRDVSKREASMRETPSASYDGQLGLVHRRFGWTSLFVWMTFGLVAELLHGIKLGGYLLDPLRREFWTLAHFHGALLAVVNLVYVRWAEAPALTVGSRVLASRCLLAGSVLMPVGFLLGGIAHYEGDPGLGIFLAPLGAALLLIAVAQQLAASWRENSKS